MSCGQADVNKRNINILVEELKEQRVKIAELEQSIKGFQNNVALLQQELQTNKQLTAHMLGRGNGPTT